MVLNLRVAESTGRSDVGETIMDNFFSQLSKLFILLYITVNLSFKNNLTFFPVSE